MITRSIALHPHAEQRLAERFGLPVEWLLERIEAKQFAWLDVISEISDTSSARGAFLFFVPEQNTFCVAIVDVTAKLIITILNEDMASRSTWAASLTKDRKKHAMLLALRHEGYSGVDYYRKLKELDLSRSTRVVAQSLTCDLKPRNITVAKIQVTMDQFLTSEQIELTDDQQRQVRMVLADAIEQNQIMPCVDLYAQHKDYRRLSVQHEFCSLKSCQDFLMQHRWADTY
ncbi:hypothetical protein J6I75_04735 [Pseudidiomarina sp. 1APP75-27a]|uniref:hypothetical protein n=1 Tax=Pseudidiomarina terrestris TaxID=2820060 RepID=UPI002B054016|nr:hypothetical protein [Pseudidiomarina sp. 1APP75-27a]MEA3587650.1 hypothetical protein [Pseudidiomarina sp. 1APP75-27a]